MTSFMTWWFWVKAIFILPFHLYAEYYERKRKSWLLNIFWWIADWQGHQPQHVSINVCSRIHRFGSFEWEENHFTLVHSRNGSLWYPVKCLTDAEANKSLKHFNTYFEEERKKEHAVR